MGWSNWNKCRWEIPKYVGRMLTGVLFLDLLLLLFNNLSVI